MVNIDNEYIRRKVLEYIKETKGKSDSSMRKYDQALKMWDRITNEADYRSFNRQIAKKFKKELRKQKYRGRFISSATVTSVLLNLKLFFEVLCLQPGYRRAINRAEIAYLNPSNSELELTRTANPPKYPTEQQMKLIYENITTKTEIGMMHKALIAFICCTGARLDAVASFPLGCFYPEILLADQDPKKGVRTKFHKHIRTYLFRFNEDMVNTILDWHAYLLDKGFGNHDPMFPACETKRLDGLSFQPSDTLSRKFLTAARIYSIIKKITKEAGFADSFNPHSFRHGVIAIAERRAQNIEQFKAVSQNVGHEKPMTTFQYAKLTSEQIKSNIEEINNKGNLPPFSEDDFEKFQQFLQWQKKNINKGDSNEL
jgi:site-specific recombinase XerD